MNSAIILNYKNQIQNENSILSAHGLKNYSDIYEIKVSLHFVQKDQNKEIENIVNQDFTKQIDMYHQLDKTDTMEQLRMRFLQRLTIEDEEVEERVVRPTPTNYQSILD